MARVAVFIVGATASGKTAFAHTLIDRFFPRARVISADSMQVYIGMDIGSAKPSKEEIARYRYAMIDCVPPTENFSVARYLTDSAPVLSEGRDPLFIVGGTGLYVRALKHGLFDEPDDDGAIRTALYARAETEGLRALYNELSERDPESARVIPETNARRVIRALETCLKTNAPFSAMQKKRAPLVPLRHITFALRIDRETLYARIDKRTERMFAEGLIDETKSLIKQGVSARHRAMQGIGYKETARYLNNEIDYDALIPTVKLHTRRYAKRQETWFRKEDAQWISPETIEETAGRIERFFLENSV